MGLFVDRIAVGGTAADHTVADWEVGRTVVEPVGVEPVEPAVQAVQAGQAEFFRTVAAG